jgi:hypothetical protein
MSRDMTFTAEHLTGIPTDDLIAEIITRAEYHADLNAASRDIGREFSLAKTAAEEAGWCFNRGVERAKPKLSTAIRDRLTERQSTTPTT